MKILTRCSFLILILVMASFAGPISQSKTLSLGLESSAQFVDAEVVAAPRPEIPSNLHEQCFKSCCIARFVIKPNGQAQVQLLSSSGSEEVDELAMSALRRWKFRPAKLNGQPVQSTRRIKVEFEIE